MAGLDGAYFFTYPHSLLMFAKTGYKDARRTRMFLLRRPCLNEPAKIRGNFGVWLHDVVIVEEVVEKDGGLAAK